MKKIISLLIFVFVSAIFAHSQDFMQYMQQGKQLFDQKDYTSALEQFDLAFEKADSDTTENDALDWKNRSLEKIKIILAEYNNSKTNAEAVLKIVLTASKTWTSSGKKLSDLSKIKAINLFKSGSFFDALNFFKFAKFSPDYVTDNEVESYIQKCTDSLNSKKKIALIIGNANYVEGNLEKVVVDAQDLEKELKSINFEVITGFNLKTGEFDEKMKQFYETSSGYGLVLVFFSGYGYQSDYLLPVDTKKDAEGNLKSWFSLNYLMSEFAKWNPNSKKIFILDMDRTIKTGVVPSVMTYDNYIVCFSTSPNNKAYNGVGRNSLFMEQFLKYVIMTNTSFQEVFRLTREATMRVSKNRQIPTIYDNIQNNMYLNWKID
jgi:tetratricopeptide (TPR) repeat protein